MYNNYCHEQYEKISIDATGGICKKIRKPNGDLCGNLFLYDITVNDKLNKKQVSVSNMISERHDADAIAYWLRRWIRDGVKIPNEIVCDMSLALLSGISVIYKTSQYYVLHQHVL